MSRIVKVQSKMTNRSIVEYVLGQKGIEYDIKGDVVSFKSGDLKDSTLNLKSGDISGDTDYRHTEETLGSLRQAYAERDIRLQIERRGGSILSRVQNKDDVVIRCQMSNL